MSHTHGITPDLVEAYGLCRRKAFLLLRGDTGDTPHEYVRLLDAHAASSLDTFVGSLEASGRIVNRHPNPELNGRADVFTHVLLKTESLEAVVDVLVRSDPGSSKARHFEPHLVVGTHTVTREQKIRLAFLGYLIAETHRFRPPTGVIVDATGRLQRIHLSKLMANLTPTIDTLNAWQTSLPSDPPPVLLNDHCPICPFRKSCLQQAEKDDSLTLLDRMTPKVMRKYHQRGIFTVTQLSFLFRPRRQRKKRRNRPTGFKLELQALALRTGKIYIHEPPSVPEHPAEIFLDLEGVPDQGTHYLIGLLVCTGGRIESHSLWADSLEEEGNIFRAMLRIVQDHPDAPIYHYGSFEPRGLDRIAKRIGLSWETVKSRLVNVNSLVFGKVYFPARSNTLKALGRLVGATWTSPDASGLQSVVWRLQCELSKDAALKERILGYNLEDCHALRLLVAELRNIGQAAATRSDVDYADAPKQNTTDQGKDIHDTLECEVTQKYQKRFIRYKESLFRFLEEDGIPWNNNTAERASRHLAVQRKISGCFFKRVAVQYLLLLGIAQTCRFQGKSFLNFLISREKDIDGFREKRRPKVTRKVCSGSTNEELQNGTAEKTAPND